MTIFSWFLYRMLLLSIYLFLFFFLPFQKYGQTMWSKKKKIFKLTGGNVNESYNPLLYLSGKFRVGVLFLEFAHLNFICQIVSVSISLCTDSVQLVCVVHILWNMNKKKYCHTECILNRYLDCVLHVFFSVLVICLNIKNIRKYAYNFIRFKTKWQPFSCHKTIKYEQRARA